MTESSQDKPAKNVGKPAISKKRKQQSRRQFLRSTALIAGYSGISLLGFLPVAQGHTLRLRPPGAIKTPSDEQEFFASCIKCGQCVQVCPVEAIKLADITDGFGIGVPYIEARDQACDFSCDGLQCVLACPTGALTHDLDYPADTRMGFARLSRPKACLAVRGEGFKGVARGPQFEGLLRYDEVDRWNPIKVAEYEYDLELCDLCVRQCPIEIRITQCAEEEKKGKDSKVERVAKKYGNECPPVHAIALEPIESADGVKRMIPMIKDGCVGCGVCEMICPAEPTAIVVDIDRITDLV
ncbi:MAG: 4Fe-4S dicluster domain-containing protein [Gammaproteobacteria bacterium]|nr:4Fe-4S dicluster domain-containing protein [Gammaproteobacteria bacterium]